MTASCHLKNCDIIATLTVWANEVSKSPLKWSAGNTKGNNMEDKLIRSKYEFSLFITPH